MENKTVILRPFRPEDQKNMLEILTSAKVNQTYMLPDFEKQEDAIPLFKRLSDLSQNPDRFVRCISMDDTAIGFMNDVEIRNGTIELGYVIHPDHHNRGYMTQALKLAIFQLFQRKFSSVICGAFEENKASQRVMEKAGMERISLTEEIEYRNKVHLCVYYEKRNEEVSC